MLAATLVDDARSLVVPRPLDVVGRVALVPLPVAGPCLGVALGVLTSSDDPGGVLLEPVDARGCFW